MVMDMGPDDWEYVNVSLGDDEAHGNVEGGDFLDEALGGVWEDYLADTVTLAAANTFIEALARVSGGEVATVLADVKAVWV